jgi:PD-(D/E)XK nuclease superfamily
MITAAGSDLKSLQSFLMALGARRSVNSQPSADRLRNFFREISRLRKIAPDIAITKKDESPLVPTRFAEFAAKFQPLHEAAWRDGFFVDVWNVAGVKTNEIRNAAVLAWLLDARQTHGRGNTILVAWLRKLDPRGEIPFLSSLTWRDRYSVFTESYPLGDTENRVDVVLETARALIFIEVKVKAPEGEHQIKRYLALANAKARARGAAMEAGVIYLTTSSAKQPMIDAPKQFIHATWIQISHAIEEVVSSGSTHPFIDRLLLQFAKHVAKF